jgi:hypothetical protein
MRSTAAECGLNTRHVARIARSIDFRVRQRQCLFLGLSDGARIDVFRRSNSRDLSNEQISRSHELADHRISELLKELKLDLQDIVGDACPAEPVFRTLVLLDDFSASGCSYYMPKPDGLVGGKLFHLFQAISDQKNPLSRLLRLNEAELIIVLYVGTEQAKQHLEKYSKQVWGKSGVKVNVEVVQPLPDSIPLSAGNCGDLGSVIDKYYDHSIHDVHLQKGGTNDSKFGFAACGLPLVMHHNTPNNSIALLWSYDDTDTRGLFPRVRRHRSRK